MSNSAIPDFIAELFRDGTLKVDSKGHVWRCKRRGRSPDSPPKPIPPRRIDTKTEVGGGSRIAIWNGSKAISIGITKIRRHFGLDRDE